MNFENEIYYRIFVNGYAYEHHKQFSTVQDSYSRDNVVFFTVTVKPKTNITVGLHTKFENSDYIVIDGKIYKGNDLYSLCAEIQNILTKNAIEALD